MRALVDELDDPAHEIELARLYASYVELRDASGHADPGLVAEAAIAALRSDPEVLRTGARCWSTGSTTSVAPSWSCSPGWRGRPRSRSRSTTRTGVRSPCARRCSGRSRRSSAPSACSSCRSTRRIPRAGCCATWTATCSSPARHRSRPTTGPLVLMSSPAPGARRRRSGSRSHACSDRGHEPDEVVVVVRRPDSGGPLLATVLRELGLPVALEASLPLAATCVGGSLLQLCRAAADDGAVDALLAHLRLDPSFPPAIADRVERRVRRGDAQTVSAATEGWERPPRHLARVLEAEDARGRLRAAGALGSRAGRGRSPRARPVGASRCRRGRRGPVLGARAAGRGRRGRAARPARCGRGAAGVRATRSARGGRGARVGVGPALAGSRRRTGPDHEPLPSARGQGSRALLCLAAGRRVPDGDAPGPAALRGAPARDRQPGPAPRRAGRRGALPVSRLRLATDRAALSQLAEHRRGRGRAGPVGVRR